MKQDKSIDECNLELNTILNSLLAEIRKRAESQYEYNLRINVPEQIAGITLNNAAENALYTGLVCAVSASYKWDTDRATRLAHHILEDSNCHTEAKALVPFIPEYK